MLTKIYCKISDRMIIAITCIIMGGFALLIADPEKNVIVSIIGMLYLLPGLFLMYIENKKYQKREEKR
ncbi:hypothetical protein [Staphylococcus equorum]|uniref:hypothetical protein n=1 Tax=Staphylococcus equorum TaxID=246432 RepID=UPI001867615F|nr:hypothetical protein [Staphylococcus equorum]